jgi:hypothetical protein
LPPYQAKNYQITVVSRPEAVRGLLGELSASKKPFVTVKAVTVSNEKKDGPKRKSDNPLAAETPDNQQSLYIVGEEKVETSLSLEILTFRDAPQSPAGQSAQPAGK